MQPSNPSRGENPLKSKIQSMISDQEVRQKVASKLEAQQINQPFLKLEVKNCKTDGFKIEEADVRKVFDCFGEVDSLVLEEGTAIIKYKDVISAYFALTVLHGKELPDLNVLIEVAWHQEPVFRAPFAELGRAVDPPESKTHQEAKEVKAPQDTDENLKYTCRFDIQIDNGKEFQVARRIIGSKGINMKRIIDKCCKGLGGRVHDVVKLRLRGKGSGFKEGPHNAESNDTLHLCISSKFQGKYKIAISEIEKLLTKVYREFSDYCIKLGLPDPQLEVIKIEKVSGRCAVLAPSRVQELEECIELNEDDIEDLIDVRNEARRQCNFMEADRIRELLRKKGVILMDEKGGRGRGVEVTNWKYNKL